MSKPRPAILPSQEDFALAVRVACWKSKKTLSAVARETGFSYSAVSKVVNENADFPRVKKALTSALHL